MGNLDEKNCTLKYEERWIAHFPTQDILLLAYRPSIVYAKIAFYSIYALFGIFGNSLSSIIWLLPDLRRKNNSAYYLASLGITDAIITVLLMIIFIMDYSGLNLDMRLNVLNNALQYFSVSLVFGFTLERWISVCFPFQRQKLCTTKRTFLAITILLFISILMASFAHIIVNIFESQMLLILNEVIFSIIVPTSALLLNVKVIFEMRRITKSKTDQNESSREHQNFVVVTTMLVTLSMYVIICNLIAGSLYVTNHFLPNLGTCHQKEEINEIPEFIKNYSYIETYQTLNIFTVSHYALNCFIYFLTNKNYRKKVISLTCRMFGREPNTSSDTNPISRSDAKTSRRRENKTNLLNNLSTATNFPTSVNESTPVMMDKTDV